MFFSKKKKSQLIVNKTNPNRIVIQCSTVVDKNAVRRETIDGVEHIIVSSKTMPDNIVMNSVLYPAEEIAASFNTLERTLAPIAHPVDADGNFLSALDPVAIHNFHAGAFNQNVRQENGRLHIDKVINVEEANKSDRGKRLLERINELENNDNPRPIHTSTCVFLEIEILDAPLTNSLNQEYTMIGRNLSFDHDAILLDEIGAAQPSDGVGMAVNAGEKFKVQSIVLNDEHLVTIEVGDVEEISHETLRGLLFDAINTPPLSIDWIEEVFDSRVIFWSGEQLFDVSYTIGNGVVTITGIPLPVERETTFIPKTNNEGDAMRDVIVNALKAAGIKVDEKATDTELFAAYNKLQLSANSDDDKKGNEGGKGGDDDEAAKKLADVVTNALQPVIKEIDALKVLVNSKDDEELNKLAEIIGNSDKYASLDTENAKKLGLETLKSMAANCVVGHGIPLTLVNADGENSGTYDMPK